MFSWATSTLAGSFPYVFRQVPPFCKSESTVVALVRLSCDVLLLVFVKWFLCCEAFVALGTAEGLVQQLIGITSWTRLMSSQLVATVRNIAAVLTCEQLGRSLSGVGWKHDAKVLPLDVLCQSLLSPFCSDCPRAKVTHELFNFTLNPFSILVHQVLCSHVSLQPWFVDVHISTLVTCKWRGLVW